MTSSDSVEQAIRQILARGWLLAALGRSNYDCNNPWFVELYPGHFGGSLYRGSMHKTGGYTVYHNAMTTIKAEGPTPAQAIRNAISELDRSPVKAVYERLERAFEEWLDARQKAGDRR